MVVVVIVVDLVLLVFPFNFAGVRKYNTGGWRGDTDATGLRRTID